PGGDGQGDGFHSSLRRVRQPLPHLTVERVCGEVVSERAFVGRQGTLQQGAERSGFEQCHRPPPSAVAQPASSPPSQQGRGRTPSNDLRLSVVPPTPSGS